MRAKMIATATLVMGLCVSACDNPTTVRTGEEITTVLRIARDLGEPGEPFSDTDTVTIPAGLVDISSLSVRIEGTAGLGQVVCQDGSEAHEWAQGPELGMGINLADIQGSWSGGAIAEESGPFVVEFALDWTQYVPPDERLEEPPWDRLSGQPQEFTVYGLLPPLLPSCHLDENPWAKVDSVSLIIRSRQDS